MSRLRINQNFHIHTHHSCDSASASIATIVKAMTDAGIEHYGISDHLHTQYNLCDLQSSRNDFLGFKPPSNFHFGVEASCVARRECERVARKDYNAWGDEPIYGFRSKDEPFDGNMAIGLTKQNIDDLGIEYVIGGVHWPLGHSTDRREIIRNYFLQQKFLVEHPLVDILAHPWDSLHLAAGDWYTYRDKEHMDWSIFQEIPASLNDELAEAVKKNEKLVEVNAACIFDENPFYSAFLKDLYTDWKRKGIHFTFGSDTHSAVFEKDLFSKAQKILENWGFGENDFALPRCCRS